MPSIIISERAAPPVSRPRRLTRTPRSLLAPGVGAPGRVHVELRDGAEQVRRGERARHGEILRCEIDHRHADSRRAADQRAGDQHRLGNLFSVLRALRFAGLRHQRVRQRQQRGRGQKRGELGRLWIYPNFLSPQPTNAVTARVQIPNSVTNTQSKFTSVGTTPIHSSCEPSDRGDRNATRASLALDQLKTQTSNRRSGRNPAELRFEKRNQGRIESAIRANPMLPIP